MIVCNIKRHPGEDEHQIRIYVERVARAIDFSLREGEKVFEITRLGNHLGYNVKYTDRKNLIRSRHYNEAQVKALLD